MTTITESVRVLVVEDSRVDSELICRMLRTSPEVKVAATTGTGRDAVSLVAKLEPDVVVLDLQLPDMGGLDVIEELMAYRPLPILVLSAIGGDKGVALEALARGAVEVMEKPELSTKELFDHHSSVLTQTVRIVSRARVITHPRRRLSQKGPRSLAALSGREIVLRPEPAASAGGPRVAVIGVAASTGGPQALQSVLSDLPVSLPVPVLVVQHIARGFTQGLVDWLGNTVSLPVQIAHDGALAAPGHVYVAAEGLHLELRHRRLVLRAGEPVGSHMPSADVLLSSMASDLRERALAVVLTGMGRDGARGARAVHDAGGKVIAQDESTSVVYGMPKAAAELGAVDEVLPIGEIASAIIRRVQAGRAA